MNNKLEHKATDKATALKLFTIFFGTIVGAGFVSGREIYIYFGRFGGWGVLATFVAGVLFFTLGTMFFRLGKKCKINSMYDYLKVTFGKLAKIVEFVVALSYIVVLGAMFAGFGSIQQILLPNFLNLPILQIISIVLCIIITFGGIKNILKINYVLLPAIIVFMAIVFVASVIDKEQSIAFIVFDNSFISLISPLLCCAIFVCSNMFLTGFILMQSGVNSDDKSIKKASVMTGGLVFLIIFFACFSIALNPSCINSDMPFLILSFKVSEGFVFFSVIVLWFSIFTTAVATLYTFSWWLNSYLKHEKISIIISAFLGLIISQFGFSIIVDNLYPLTGFMDITFVVCSIVLYLNKRQNNMFKTKFFCKLHLKNKNNISKNQKTKIV